MQQFSLEYLVRQPKSNIARPPLLIMLHGYGSNEQDLFSFAEELPDELLILSLRAPLTMGYDSYAWYSIHFDQGSDKFSDIPEAKTALKRLNEFVDQALEHFDIDRTNVFLLGFSQGTILSIAYALNHPEKIHHVVALSGYVNQELIEKPLEKESLKNLDFYVSHGIVDQVIPVEWARNTSPFLNKIGIDHVYKEYPVGHGVAPANFFDLKSWIEKRL